MAYFKKICGRERPCVKAGKGSTCRCERPPQKIDSRPEQRLYFKRFVDVVFRPNKTSAKRLADAQERITDSCDYAFFVLMTALTNHINQLEESVDRIVPLIDSAYAFFQSVPWGGRPCPKSVEHGKKLLRAVVKIGTMENSSRDDVPKVLEELKVCSEDELAKDFDESELNKKEKVTYELILGKKRDGLSNDSDDEDEVMDTEGDDGTDEAGTGDSPCPFIMKDGPKITMKKICSRSRCKKCYPNGKNGLMDEDSTVFMFGIKGRDTENVVLIQVEEGEVV